MIVISEHARESIEYSWILEGVGRSMSRPCISRIKGSCKERDEVWKEDRIQRKDIGDYLYISRK